MLFFYLKKQKMENETFVIERTFNAPVSKIWKAITDKKEMKKWYFDVSDFKPELGFEFQFEGRNEDRVYIHLCKVVDVVEGKKLSYSWRYKGYKGISFVTFELFEEGKKTRLKLTHEGIETIAVNGPDFAKNNFVQGWTAIIGTSLKEYLEKITINK
jgi:uncharacterized protein YndB with AHSA1/START domain